ncbi:hypothetical protein GCM10010978_29600 [Compostibacillus humi]|uniref:t-SNARE coiled-coil homology domain-containing protein n=1 Tax=Compostibacillus humi TaxID=1245525 RepID=A0A8J2XJ42_9BACI|nr:hypothetical protein [Compostibacillus humi]GFZ87950.1 hypothetical protein GCM10010978_29600 [Compostibacillus humi]
MDNQTLLQEILKAFQLYGERMDKRFEQIDKRFLQIDNRFQQIDVRFQQIDKRFQQVDNRFQQIDKRFEQMDSKMDKIKNELEDKIEIGFNRLNKKIDGQQEEIADLKETTNFLLSKAAKHEKKLQQLSEHHT